MRRLPFAVALACFAVLTVAVGVPGTTAPPPPAPDTAVPHGGDLDRAEALRTEGSYALALEIYRNLADGDVPEDEARWLALRIADCTWRSLAATEQPDPTDFQHARAELQRIVQAAKREEDRDRVWAEAQESLGDSWWSTPHHNNWHQAWSHYRTALEWWAAGDDIELARKRYLAIIHRAARPAWVQPWYVYPNYGNELPLPTVEDAHSIAVDRRDVAFTSYLLAMGLRNRSDTPARYDRAVNAFEAAVEGGGGTPWHDDALFQYAQFVMAPGRPVRVEGGGMERRADYPEGVRLLRRLVATFDKGESRYHDQAVRQIDDIVKPTLRIMVPATYLPGSEIELALTWRNVEDVDLAIHRVDLREDFTPASDRSGPEVGSGIDIRGRQPLRSWTRVADGTRHDHEPRHGSFRLDEALDEGAYLVTAKGGGHTARELLLVSRLATVVKTRGRDVLVYAADAIDGTPVAGAGVTAWEGRWRSRKYVWTQVLGATGGDGVARLRLPSDDNAQLVVLASDGAAQAVANGHAARYGAGRADWSIYAFTDRTAYRPGNAVSWKIIARRWRDDGYHVPPSDLLTYRVTGPRGQTVAEGPLETNAFGSAWGEIALDDDATLGMYNVQFLARGDHVAQAQFFRVEEYKLPEFTVRVEVPEADGRPRTFRAGDDVEADIAAEYYFGGPVAGAEVRVVVRRKPRYVRWRPERPYAWLRTSQPQPYSHWNPGEQVLETTAVTDSDGRARIVVPTPAHHDGDFEYVVEARVTDASRREVSGSGSVMVTRQPYFVFAEPAHRIHRPDQRVTVDFVARDANELPVQAGGTVTVSRDRWEEVWVDPRGREVTGDALASVRRKGAFPPSTEPGAPSWWMKFRGYRTEVVDSRPVSTDADGKLPFTFTPRDEGFYRIAWDSEVDDLYPVHAEAPVWVTGGDPREIGYHPDGLQIIVDRETFRTGDTAVAMVTTPTPGASVLFGTSPGGLDTYRVLRMDGTAKLVRIDIADEHVPNLFLDATMVLDAQTYDDTQEITVPPTDRLVEVSVDLGPDVHDPGADATATVRTVDANGDPIAAEVALGVVDESVLAIQQAIAPDPRAFFWGTRRSFDVRTSTAFQFRAYRKLLPQPEDAPVATRPVEGWEDHRKDDSGAAPPGGPRMAGFAANSIEEMEAVQDLDVEGGMRQRKMVAKKEARDAFAPTAETASGGSGEVVVRTDFRETALWSPAVATGEDGVGTVTFRLPESLTKWSATARAITRDTRVGVGEGATRTSKPLTVRLQGPRFLVEGDVATISAVINNRTEEPLDVRPALRAEGVAVDGDADHAVLRIEPGSEARADWTVRADRPGTARFAVRAVAGDRGDAMARSYPVYPHGVDRFLSRSGKARGDTVEVGIDLPDRREGSTTFTVQVTPSLAVTMLDALPYLLDYPYGCTEQTMSRFLPAVLVARTLENAGIDPADVEGRLFGGIEPEHAAATHPGGRKSLGELGRIVRKGLKRLRDFQHGDGGWGWWKDGDTDAYMTAYVVWGLAEARDADVSFDRSMLHRGVAFLDRDLVNHELRLDLQAWLLHAVTAADGKGSGDAARFRRAAFDNLWDARDRLNAYGKALLTLSAHAMGDAERAGVLARNLANGVRRDDAPDRSILVKGSGRGARETMATAHWGRDGMWRRWSDGPVETTAFALKALLAVDPGGDLVEPVVHWMIKNRRGAQWSNTRDTAMSLMALTDYLVISGELTAGLSFDVEVNGRKVASTTIEPDAVVAAPSRFTIDPTWLRDGPNTVRIARTAGEGAMYFAVDASFFSLEEPIPASGNELFVRRTYYRLAPKETLLRGTRYDRVPLTDGGTVISGERVEVVVTFEAKNDLEYVVLEDLKPAGLEAVRLRSGEPLYARRLAGDAPERDAGERDRIDHTGETRWVYQELRDRKIAMFLDRLPEGIWEVRYELRAEVPGAFHGLPLMGHAMYVPEIRANGEEIRLTVRD